MIYSGTAWSKEHIRTEARSNEKLAKGRVLKYLTCLLMEACGVKRQEFEECVIPWG